MHHAHLLGRLQRDESKFGFPVVLPVRKSRIFPNFRNALYNCRVPAHNMGIRSTFLSSLRTPRLPYKHLIDIVSFPRVQRSSP